MSDPMRAVVSSIMNDIYPVSRRLRVGLVTQHPDGRTVKVMSGCFLDPIYGRLSNWWTWREVEGDGLGPEESGYGWDVKPEATDAD